MPVDLAFIPLYYYLVRVLIVFCFVVRFVCSILLFTVLSVSCCLARTTCRPRRDPLAMPLHVHKAIKKGKLHRALKISRLTRFSRQPATEFPFFFPDTRARRRQEEEGEVRVDLPRGKAQFQWWIENRECQFPQNSMLPFKFSSFLRSGRVLSCYTSHLLFSSVNLLFSEDMRIHDRWTVNYQLDRTLHSFSRHSLSQVL